nr:hypothetical protein [Tanacetum cinerariifolium]
MGRDTIQLKTAVSTISQEYLLEFTSEYGISEDLHPELPGPEERIVDFSKVKTSLRPRAAHEVPLLTATASRVIDIEDLDVAIESFGTPSAIEKSPLDFDNENPSPPMTESKGTEDQSLETVAPEIPPSRNMPATGAASEVSLEEEVTAMGPRLSKKRRRRVNDGADANAPAKIPTRNVATMEVQATHFAESAGSGKLTSSPFMVGSSGGIYQPGWGVTNSYRLDTPDACQDVVDQIVSPRLLKKAKAQIARRDQRLHVKEEEIKKLDQEVQGLQNQTSNLKTLLEAEADMKKSAKAKNADLTKELESLHTQFSDPQRCAEMDAHLDALSIDFDEELYPHILTTIAGRWWVIGHGLRLAVMKCAESIELRHAFANVVSAGIAKCMSEGLAHGIEHGKASRYLEVMEAYDPEANNKHLQALQEMKDLKYPIVDQLEGLKDAPMEVRDPRNPWAVKDEMLLEKAIAANVSRTEKKNRCRVVCRTHGVGFAHHAKSNGVPVSMPTVTPQGLAILLAGAATQTETSEDYASPRLLRSKSLPPMYNLDWP